GFPSGAAAAATAPRQATATTAPRATAAAAPSAAGTASPPAGTAEGALAPQQGSAPSAAAVAQPGPPDERARSPARRGLPAHEGRRAALAPGERLDQDEALLDPRGIDRDAHRAVLQAAAGEQVEVLLVDRRGDDRLALQVADDAAREHVRARERVAVGD